jgi:hypothetical protein
MKNFHTKGTRVDRKYATCHNKLTQYFNSNLKTNIVLIKFCTKIFFCNKGIVHTVARECIEMTEKWIEFVKRELLLCLPMLSEAAVTQLY